MEVNGHNLCIGCMNKLGHTQICPVCGLNQREYASIPRCLIPGTQLNERYWIGKVIGEGSFGITYIGWDAVLALPVAIKEYYPSDLVSRDVLRGADRNVYIYTSIDPEEYEQQLNNFLKEARNLTRFNQLDSIVSVHDFFYENNTAYIVMQYVEGQNLKNYIKEHGPMPAQEVLELFHPIMEALVKIHETGMIHRDISPDNILIDSKKRATLIDFGSAKIQNAYMTKSLTVVFKRGFSPEEQYRSKGKQGDWTDVYSLCSSMYYALTGMIPDEAIQRTIDDHVVSLNKMDQVKLDKKRKRAIMKGMEVYAQNRFTTVSELIVTLYENKKTFSLIRLRKNVVGVATLLIILFAGAWLLHISIEEKNSQVNIPADATEVNTSLQERPVIVSQDAKTNQDVINVQLKEKSKIEKKENRDLNELEKNVDITEENNESKETTSKRIETISSSSNQNKKKNNEKKSEEKKTATTNKKTVAKKESATKKSSQKATVLSDDDLDGFVQ